MRIVSKEEFLINKNEFLRIIEEGAVFVYPTDTIYGIGCSALNPKAVQKIRELKNRSNAPFSIIAPSREWIAENCEMHAKAEEWLSKLPGPYSLVMKKKNKGCVAKEVTLENDTLGVRIPDHWLIECVNEMGIPIVTTSVNKTGMAFMTSVEDIDPEIKAKVDFIIDEGVIKGRPSNIIFLDKGEVSVRDRRK